MNLEELTKGNNKEVENVFTPVLHVKISARIRIKGCALPMKSGAHVFSKIKGDRYGYQNL